MNSQGNRDPNLTHNPKKKRKLVQGLLQPSQSAQGREYLYSGGIRIKNGRGY